MPRSSTALTLIALALAVSLIVGPAGAQFFQFGPFQPQYQPQPQPQPQYQPRPQPRPAVPAQPQASAPPAPPPQSQPAPYDHDLERLSEILGALHFLRGICGSNEGLKWRTEAQTLIDAEAPNGNRHDQMVASFNRGYRGFQQSYRSCTPAATLVIHRYLAEGAGIAREITARYAN
jgi:uncharacterized protein (TIGR02301 family)